MQVQNNLRIVLLLVLPALYGRRQANDAHISFSFFLFPFSFFLFSFPFLQYSPTVLPTASPTSSPTAPTQQPTPKPTYLDNYEHVVERVDSVWECPQRTDELPVLMAVTNREVVLGCHSFEQYLSPKYETVFILNEDFAKLWEVGELVRTVTCDTSLRSTLLMLDNNGGELLGRRLAVDFMEREVLPHRHLYFLNQMNWYVTSIATQPVICECFF